MSGLELLLKELNPRYDLARHTYDDGHSFLAVFQDFGICLFNQAKSVVRGGIIGGVVGVSLGSLYSLISGEEFLKGLEYGGGIGLALGASLDLVQYTFRFGFYANRQMDKIRLSRNKVS